MIDLEAIKSQLAAITPGRWASLSAFILTDEGGDWMTDLDESFMIKAPTLVASLVAEVERLQSENSNLKSAGGWSLLMEAKTKPLKAKAVAWDKLRADVQTLDTPCRQWVEGLMVDLIR